ncbi:MAG: gephyrin-like molybdotransferase Glp [Myxococcota bacterium]
MEIGLTPAKALRAILSATPVLGPETVAVRDALGRVLAAPVASTRDLPPADNAAMDGYAVRVADLVAASRERPVELAVVQEIAAGGSAKRPLRDGEAARIFTGAPVPEGAEAVVRQEDTQADDGRVRIFVAAAPHENIRNAGEEVRSADLVFEPGTVIGPPHVGMLASLGRSVVAVHQRPRVAILSGGDELVEPDESVEGDRIVSSNSYSLAAHCIELGAEPVYLGIARDTREDLERHVRAGLGADVIVSSAGVSVGDRDYVREVLTKVGCSLVFWGVTMKPGYPLAFGRFADGTGPLVFGLPGNPVSAMMTFEQFVRPAIRKMTGHRDLFRPTIQVTLGETLTKKSGRLHFVRVLLERVGDDVIARSTGTQSSGVLKSMTRAQGLLVFPADATEIRAGEGATVQVLDPGFFGSDRPAF